MVVWTAVIRRPTQALKALTESQGPATSKQLDGPKGLTCLENTEQHLQRDVQHKAGILPLSVINLH